MPSVSCFLLDRLAKSGVRHVFGLPGDYILSTFRRLENSSDIELVSNTDETPSGFAADAYARVKGIGAVCVTYNVGALKVMNAVAQAYAEYSPLVVVVGSPGIKERNEPILLHHTVGDYDTQRMMFEKITCANTVLDNPATAGYEIDRVLEALKHHSRPVYIELPRDIAEKPIQYDPYTIGTPKSIKSDPVNLEEALEEVFNWIKAAKDPVILAGVEISRFALAEPLLTFAERSNIPIFTEALSKSAIPEGHPLFGGVYAGSVSQEHVRKAVESSDCLLMLGVLLTDMIFGFRHVGMESRNTVRANIERLKVRNHVYPDVVFKDFCEQLFKLDPGKRPNPILFRKKSEAYVVQKNKAIMTSRYFQKIDSILKENMVVIADIGDSLFGSLELSVRGTNSFISPAFYTPMGSSIPAALGVMMANKNVRPIVLVGDGAFQMSFSEISTFVRRGLNPIICVLNNGGYTTERFLLDGKFNDIHDWKYHKVNEIFGGGSGYLVKTEEELDVAMDAALQSDEVSVINVVVDKVDITPALRRMTEGLSKRI